MKLAGLPSGMTDWATVPSSEHPGESGRATVRSRQFGEIQLRMVEYSASYVGDHWCHKRHLTYVVSGQMVIEHEDGRRLTIPAGTSYHVADDDGRGRWLGQRDRGHPRQPGAAAGIRQEDRIALTRQQAKRQNVKWTRLTSGPLTIVRRRRVSKNARELTLLISES